MKTESSYSLLQNSFCLHMLDISHSSPCCLFPLLWVTKLTQSNTSWLRKKTLKLSSIILDKDSLKVWDMFNNECFTFLFRSSACNEVWVSVLCKILIVWVQLETKYFDKNLFKSNKFFTFTWLRVQFKYLLPCRSSVSVSPNTFTLKLDMKDNTLIVLLPSSWIKGSGRSWF